jgi:agmatine deiminase
VSRRIRAALPVAQPSPPAKSGLRFPAEWEPHEATWVGWPHHAADWPGKFATIPWVYGEIVRRVSIGEKARVIVDSPAHESRARRVLRRVGVNLSQVEFFQVPTDRGWTRDFGPLFVRQERDCSLGIAGFRFNGWAKYSNHKRDAQVARKLAARLGVEFRPVEADREFVLEGGAIDVNGRGTLLTTEECLLDPAVQPRDPGRSRHEIEQVLAKSLGATNVLWFGKGVAGDDTHGHVDDLCRFVGPRTVVLCREDNPHDANYRPLAENWERVQNMRTEDGSKLEVVPLPMPGPLYFDKRRRPASYANFYIANAAVLVPTFNDPNDRVALGTLAELIRDRPVIGIHAVDLVWGLGTLHCLTQQQPARVAACEQ